VLAYRKYAPLRVSPQPPHMTHHSEFPGKFGCYNYGASGRHT